MASYTITTTRKQEAGLKYSYDTLADKVAFPTQQAYFQSRINMQVTDPMFEQQQRAQAASFDASFKTVPETQQPAARTEIEAVITTHGGQIVVPAPPGPPQPLLAPSVIKRDPVPPPPLVVSPPPVMKKESE